MTQLPPAPDVGNLAAEVLRRARIKVPFWRMLTGKRTVLIATAVAVVAHALYLLRPHEPVAGEGDPVARILATVAAGLAFAFTYVQWHLGREEASYDKYYDRMKLVNEHIDAAGREYARLRELAPKEEPASWLLDHHRNMITFAELDNLEYVLGKRRLNYVEDDLVERAVRTFKAQCAQAWFCEKVRFWTVQTELGYRPRTRAAARFLAGLDTEKNA
jgi:hypothetical protein